MRTGRMVNAFLRAQGLECFGPCWSGKGED
jgi:hypothetical protein